MKCETIIVASQNWSFGQLGRLVKEQIGIADFDRLTVTGGANPFSAHYHRLRQEIAFLRRKHETARVFLVGDQGKNMVLAAESLAKQFKGCEIRPVWAETPLNKKTGAVICCADSCLHTFDGLMSEVKPQDDDLKVYAFQNFPFFLEKENKKVLAWLRRELTRDIQGGLTNFWFIGHNDCDVLWEAKLCSRDILGSLNELIQRLKSGVRFPLPCPYGVANIDRKTGKIEGEIFLYFG